MNNPKKIIIIFVAVLALVFLVNNFKDLTGNIVYSNFVLQRGCSGRVIDSKLYWNNANERNCFDFCESIKGVECCQVNIGNNFINCYARKGAPYFYNDINVRALDMNYPTKEGAKCNDGTLYDQCSSTKPKYCDNGNLINNCRDRECGCPSDKPVCLNDGSCISLETNLGINYIDYIDMPNYPNIIVGDNFKIRARIINNGVVDDNNVEVRLSTPSFLKVEKAWTNYNYEYIYGEYSLEIPLFKAGDSVFVVFDVSAVSSGEETFIVSVDGDRSDKVVNSYKARIVAGNLINVQCVDSDGYNYNIKGAATKGSFSSYDLCQKGGFEVSECVGNDCELVENYCDNNEIKSITTTCPVWCKNGACVQELKCTDSDAIEPFYDGKNPNTKGIVTSYYSWAEDTCSYGGRVLEYYCSEQGSTYYGIDLFCENGCINGECKRCEENKLRLIENDFAAEKCINNKWEEINV